MENKDVQKIAKMTIQYAKEIIKPGMSLIDLRNDLALQNWQRPYEELNDEQQKAIREIYPQRISEAEPKKYGERR